MSLYFLGHLQFPEPVMGYALRDRCLTTGEGGGGMWILNKSCNNSNALCFGTTRRKHRPRPETSMNIAWKHELDSCRTEEYVVSIGRTQERGTLLHISVRYQVLEVGNGQVARESV